MMKTSDGVVDEEGMEMNETDAPETVLRIYEIGYQITPALKEEDLEKIVGGIRSVVEQAGGSFIAEGAPSMMKLAYPMPAREGEKNVEYDRGYFGWIKFEAKIEVAGTLEIALKQNANLFRYIVFQTVREDTRAKMKAPQLREVKRTEPLKAAPRRVEESAAPISEEQLAKAIEDITAE
ncbi:hypothetical protein A2851_04780 [Candidatus Kaiserbacteria bacterium RIFCSPHIGHO2_01_FULL_53_29]|uniref:Small ribosomal subunit protein bS6 n=1 Tax=Candidatus Kaiserbacteria bacterium RIFCSPHIGHO2_01_FULL_53_29 TaxID=1798480 RepID=A0A1F6CTE4_9BACT|nr:MAG: hypothetical protein A2851_04780 [Candidatus Kaiserbacteria bacterium RIFCSPHIGHO2_01_FULL_53_29]